MKGPQYLSRGIDHLGDLGAKLRDLQGFSTLAYELIQNADDVPKARSMTFSVSDDLLVVDNDGIFSDCQRIEEGECPWKTDPAREHRCDFHRFRHIASGDKRGEAGTTGAFGIGFIAVYQITDVPELISAGRHWILHEDRPEHQRIEICPGCVKCTSPDLPGTRFILPWARDPQSKLRQGLQAEPVSPDAPRRILNELERSLPIAMLFLKRLRSIEVKWNGNRRHAFQREDDSDSLILSDGDPNNDRIWHLIKGDFSEVARSLRAKHSGRIEEKRSATVMLAIPAIDHPTGLLCAYLPTQQDTGLPFYINADFFPTSDRKRVILAEDYQSAWNREALAAAAIAVEESLGRLPTLLGATRFWSFLSALKQVAETERGEPTLAEFWRVVEPRLKAAKVIYTTTSTWTSSTESVLLLQKEEAAAIPILESMGMSVVHEDLRPYQPLLRSEAVGVPLLDIGRLCNTLAAHGLTKRTEPAALPSFLTDRTDCETLWWYISLLLERQQRTPKVKADDEQRLKEIALAPGRDGALWPCGQLFIADKSTVSLFQSLGAELPFAEDDPEFEPLAHLCRRFDAKAAIQFLGNIGGDPLASAWKEGRLLLSNLFAWFENRRQEILDSQVTKQDFARLSIFPSSGKLRRLSELALPGNFDDYLGLAELVDLPAIGGRREFLADLGMAILDFKTYACRLPKALEDSDIATEKRRAVIALLASRLGEIKDDQEVHDALAAAALIACADGEFQPAESCYFDGNTVRDCLGESVHFAVLPSNRDAAFRDLYEWLGVAHEPRLDDLLVRVKVLANRIYSPDVALVIVKIVEHLGKIVEGELPAELDALRDKAWLPAQGKADRWYRPGELFASNRSHIFHTQALFLDMRGASEQVNRFLKEGLMIRFEPTVSLVIQHLLYCCDKAISVHPEVYRFLNDKAEDPALNLLKDKKCLLLGDSYLAPSQVFWGDHPFGRFRRRLSEELRPYNKLLQRIDVRDTPDHEDAFKVLSEIAEDFGRMNRPLDEEAHAVLMACWRSLENTLDDDDALMGKVALLRKVKCVPNSDRVLNPPEWMFFENRAGLAAKFGEFLKGNVIPRPIGVGTAMAAAGVRSLGSAVEVQLLECAGPTEDFAMAARIRERKNQFGRVLESQIPGHETVTALRRLEKLQCEAASSLLIRYHLSAFNQELESIPETVPALYQREAERLLFIRRNGKVSWSALARELAIALFPDEDPGRIAAGLKEVLAAESAESAAATLDELGFARLDTSITKPPELGGSITTLGTVSPVEPLSMTPEEAIKSLLGAGAPAPTPPPAGLGTEPQPGDGRSGTGTTVGPEKKKARPVLRSYLPAPGTSDILPPGGDDGGETQGRALVDEAGVRRVLEYETKCGRTPKEMPHNNPGYDIESRDASGKVVRYIEVKSFSGQWNHAYAVLSRLQFEKATRLGDAFWLYVVERAEADNFRIHRIQSPALKANHFMFDDGWSATGEQDDTQKEG